MKQTFTVTEGAAGERLDVFLAKTLHISRSQIQHSLADYTTVNGRPERPSYPMQKGDRVSYEPAPAEAPPAPEEPPQLPVVYEDADLLVIDKPAGLAVHPGSGRAGEATVAGFARAHTTDPDPERPGIVHRLDRDTSGLLVLAKTPDAKAFMQEQFREHRVRKTYELLAVGRVDPPSATIRLPLDRDPANPLRRAVVANGRTAVTNYKTLESYPGYTLIEAGPETGRTHQIRVHFAAIGHPVAGDTTYGPPKRPPGLSRQFLHASGLEFHAPGGNLVTLHSPLPPELTGIIKNLQPQV